VIDVNDVLFIKPYRLDDTDLTGGISTNTEITDDELSNVFRDVSSEYIFWGGERFRKLFINNSASGVFYNVGVYVSVDSQSDDYFSVVAGTATDYGKDADDYTEWSLTGTLNSAIVGRNSKPEGPLTDSFYVLCNSAVSGTGFYNNSRVIISQAGRSEIASISEVSWSTQNLIMLTIIHGMVDSFSIGATVSSIHELGDIEAGDSTSIWLKQTIPINTNYRRLCKVKIGVLGG